MEMESELMDLKYQLEQERSLRTKAEQVCMRFYIPARLCDADDDNAHAAAAAAADDDPYLLRYQIFNIQISQALHFSLFSPSDPRSRLFIMLSANSNAFFAFRDHTEHHLIVKHCRISIHHALNATLKHISISHANLND